MTLCRIFNPVLCERLVWHFLLNAWTTNTLSPYPKLTLYPQYWSIHLVWSIFTSQVPQFMYCLFSPLSNSLPLSKCTCVLMSIVKALWTRAKITSVNKLTFYISFVTYKPHKYEGSPSRNANSKMTIVKISVNQPASQPASQWASHPIFIQDYMPDSLVGIRGNKNNHDRYCICSIEFKV